MNKKIIEYSENLETINSQIKNSRQKITSLNYKIDYIKNEKNSITGRMVYYGLFACCSIFSFLFGTIPAIIIGLGIITLSTTCLGIAGYKKKKINHEIDMHTNEISRIQDYINQLTQEASKNSVAISECYKNSNAQSLTNNKYNQKVSKKSIEYVK